MTPNNKPSSSEVYENRTNALKLKEIATGLQLPWYTTNLSLVLYHRFHAAKYPSPPSPEIIIIGCLSLGMKIRETFKKLNEIYSNTMLIFHNREQDIKKEVYYILI